MIEALALSPDFCAGVITGGFGTLTMWLMSTNEKLNTLIGAFNEHVRGGD